MSYFTKLSKSFLVADLRMKYLKINVINRVLYLLAL